MKRMKIALIAVIAIVMGTTFTSCLDSDSGPSTYYVSGVVSDYLGRITITANDVDYVVTNGETMWFADDDKNEFLPRVVTVAFNQIEGEDYTEGKSSYNIYVVGYYEYYFEGDVTTEDYAESLTPLSTIESAVGGFGYVCTSFTYKHKDTKFDDFCMYVDRWENNKLYVKLVHREAVSSTEKGGLAMCFRLPRKSQLQYDYPEIQFTGDDQNIIDVVVFADGENDSTLSSETFKAVILN